MKKLLDWLNEPEIGSAECEFRYFLVLVLLAIPTYLAYSGCPH